MFQKNIRKTWNFFGKMHLKNTKKIKRKKERKKDKEK